MRVLAAAAVVAAYMLLCVATVYRHRQRMRPAQAGATPALSRFGAQGIWVLHASQTGTAEALAQQTAQALVASSIQAQAAPLASLAPEQWRSATHVLLVLATCGEGDAPDSAAAFVSTTMPSQPALEHLRFGLLALGDSSFRHFCGFGRTVQHWLVERGAQPWFDAVEVDRGSEVALAQWRECLSHAVGSAAGETPALHSLASGPPGTQEVELELLARVVLNPDSPADKLVLLRFAITTEHGPDLWQAGDLLQLAPPADLQRSRSYSIASVPASGTLDLIVREQAPAPGRPGLCSRWLCGELGLRQAVSARVRAQPGFRLGEHAGRPLVLIGNGSGLAGLRAHLQALAQRRQVEAAMPGAWLVYGERHADLDRPCHAELTRWQTTGVLARMDRVYSRSAAGSEARYVQHRLIEVAPELRAWVQRGAAIYVCGSLSGMASGVQAALGHVLGEAAVAGLHTEGRLRRDVY